MISLRERCIRLAELNPELRKHIVPMLRNAIGYDAWKDRQLERGTFRRQQDIPAKPPRPEPPKDPYTRESDWLGEITLENTENLRGMTKPVSLPVRYERQPSGLFSLTVISPYNAKQLLPPLDLSVVAKRLPHFEWTKSDVGVAMTLRAWYRLPEAKIPGYAHRSEEASDPRTALREFERDLRRSL